MAILIFFVANWYLSLFCQTFFQHRYGAHGAFTMSKGWERFFFILTWLTQGSSYLSPRAYAIMHRMHHAFTDTDKDPHSPSYSTGMLDMMWKTKVVYTSVYDNAIPIEERFTKNVPDWPLVDRLAHSWVNRIIWAGLYLAFYIHFATSPWLYLLLPIQLIMGPFHGMVINWFAHKFGYRNFEMKNTSENLFHVDVLMLGEAYHNNHHKHASNPNFGYRKHEVDPIYPIILLFNKLGIIKLKNTKTFTTPENEEHELKLVAAEVNETENVGV